jgi:hypothetical protein
MREVLLSKIIFDKYANRKKLAILNVRGISLKLSRPILCPTILYINSVSGGCGIEPGAKTFSSA